jgi:hypothetical protein
MNRRLPRIAAVLLLPALLAADETEKYLLQPCCMSLVTKTRTARTVGKGRLCVSLKFQEVDYNLKRGGDDEYHGFDGHYQQLKSSLSFKYGWAKNHHVGVSVPFIWNDIEIGSSDMRNEGLANVAVFEKWNFLPEGTFLPAIAIDAWYYLGTGHNDRKLGSTHPFLKLTAEFSKTWPLFSLHLNPVYALRDGPDSYEVNAAFVFTPCRTLWPAVEYNFESYREKGRSHDIVPCLIWKFHKGWCAKLGTVINVESTKSYRDRLGLVGKLSYTF